MSSVENGDRQERERQIRLDGRRYGVVAAPPQLLVGLEVGAWNPDERLILAGDLSRIAFPEIVSLVAHTRMSGVLRVLGASVMRTISFADGEVRGAASSRVGERLGDVMVRLGQLDHSAAGAFQLDSQAGRPAGRLAVERGLVSERDLWRAVQEHVTAVFQAILLDAGGSFLLTDARVADLLTLPGLSAEALLMEGVRRLDEMRMSAGSAGEGPVHALLDAYDSAFRDIFATAAEAGVGSELHSAATSILEDDPAHVEIFGELRFGAAGELPLADLAKHADRVAGLRGTTLECLLGETLSTLTLFLLFVAGEHLVPEVHRALHARVKAIVSRS